MRPIKRGKDTSVCGFGCEGEPGGDSVRMGEVGVEFILADRLSLDIERAKGKELMRIVAAEGMVGERRSVGGDMTGGEGVGAAIACALVSRVSLGGGSMGPEWSVTTTRIKSPGRVARDVVTVESIRVWARFRASWREAPGPRGSAALFRAAGDVAKTERPRVVEGGREYLSAGRRI